MVYKFQDVPRAWQYINPLDDLQNGSTTSNEVVFPETFKGMLA